eukprot:4082023-Pyramimonas_sp.AAC.3
MFLAWAMCLFLGSALANSHGHEPLRPSQTTHRLPHLSHERPAALEAKLHQLDDVSWKLKRIEDHKVPDDSGAFQNELPRVKHLVSEYSEVANRAPQERMDLEVRARSSVREVNALKREMNAMKHHAVEPSR